jgi:eukaryotic-like serine/threonine-protein kinase
METDRWQRLKEVFQEALELAPADRGAYVEAACGGDVDLRRDVEALLDADEESSGFLSESADSFVPGLSEAAQSDADVGREIGPYRILREIGAGGMGTVYLAERTGEFRQEVALKLLPRGMDTRKVVSRFRYERQILAGLRHPNIASLLDGGSTEDGRPYFVMEYVEGTPIDTYCRQHGLPVQARLELFRKVCAAVQYAHQNLVVHRDLKPGNILVTAEGTPKLLDFGIAKLLRPDTTLQSALTQPGVRPMTPEYASPEQVRGLAVNTASDVYSLGVVLYELLTGEMPYRFEGRSITEIERVVCEVEPLKPSAVTQSVRLAGDLDTILLKALEKDPERRYPSVEPFSEDLRRHLEGRPIGARPATTMYRMRKFVRRNRTGVAATALVALSLIAGLITTTWQAHVARQQRERAERRFSDVRRLANTFLFEFHDKIKDLNGATEARQLVVAKALEYLDSLSREAAGDTSLQLELAEAYIRLGDVQGNPYTSNIGDAPGALASYAKSIRTAQAVLDREPRNARALRSLGRAGQQRGEVLMITGKEAEGVASAREAVRRFDELAAAYPDQMQYRTDLASGLESLADGLGNPGLPNLDDAAGAAAAYRRSIETWSGIAARDPGNERMPRALAVLAMKLGDLESGAERLEPARALYQEALGRLEKADLGNPENLRVASSIRRKLAYVLSYTNLRGALEQYQESIGGLQKLVALDPRNSRTRMDLAVSLRQAGELLETVPSMQKAAMDCYRMVLNHFAEIESVDPGNLRRQELTAEVSLRLGRLLAVNGSRDEGRRVSARGLQLARELAERPEPTPRQVSFYAEALLRVEPVELKEPETALREAARASEAVAGRNPTYLDLMAEAHYQAGRKADAVALGERALALTPADSAMRKQLLRHLEKYRGK